jgi:hypothetical protein
MSLLTSIFGETGRQQERRRKRRGEDDDDGMSSYDLFGPKVVDAAAHPIAAARKSRPESAVETTTTMTTTTMGGEGTTNDVDECEIANSSQIAVDEEDGAEEEEGTIDDRAKELATGARNESREEEEEDDEKSRTIFVGNLPPDISRRALANMFRTCGIVISSRLRSLAVTGVKLPPEQAGNQVRTKTVVELSWLIYSAQTSSTDDLPILDITYYLRR